MQLDTLDKKILAELSKDSRTPILTLARKVLASREVVLYRIRRLEKEKIILGYTTEIDFEKIGLIGAAVFVNVKQEEEEHFYQYLKSCPFVSWVARLSGVWNFGLSVYGRSLKELDRNFQELKNKFILHNFRFSMHRRNYFFYDKLFSKETRKKISNSFSYRIDLIDKKILFELTKNSRIQATELSSLVKITAPAVAKRIRSLEKSGYIQKYGLFLDYSRLGKVQYGVFIISNSYEKIIPYLFSSPQVNYVAEYLGEPFLEFGVILDDPYQLRPFLEQLEQKYPLQIMEVSLFQKEVVSVSPPKIAFE